MYSHQKLVSQYTSIQKYIDKLESKNDDNSDIELMTLKLIKLPKSEDIKLRLIDNDQRRHLHEIIWYLTDPTKPMFDGNLDHESTQNVFLLYILILSNVQDIIDLIKTRFYSNPSPYSDDYNICSTHHQIMIFQFIKTWIVKYGEYDFGINDDNKNIVNGFLNRIKDDYTKTEQTQRLYNSLVHILDGNVLENLQNNQV